MPRIATTQLERVRRGAVAFTFAAMTALVAPARAQLSFASAVDLIIQANRLLRPEGRSGPLVRSLASYVAYWDRWAQTWEFQALLKARPSAGDAELGRAFAEQAAVRVWGRPLGAASPAGGQSATAGSSAASAWMP